MFEHFDERARMCVVLAQEEARRLGHDEIGTVHLLLGIGRIDEGLLGVEAETLRASVVALQGSGATPTVDVIPFAADATATLKGANAQALALGHTTIEVAHVLLALMETGGGGARALREAGAIPSEVRERALTLAGSGAGPGGAAGAQAGWTAYADPDSSPDEHAAERLLALRDRAARATRTPTAEHAAGLRAGHPLTVSLGGDGPLGDLGNPNVDRQLLELLLVNDTHAARLLRERGIDEVLLRERFGSPDERG